VVSVVNRVNAVNIDSMTQGIKNSLPTHVDRNANVNRPVFIF
jgi:hypothetical protein